ncbi:MAG: response regulator [Treponema sp.]|nr:response regulator [Treponema sp.]
MDNNNFTEYALLHNKYYRITIPLTTVIAFLIMIFVDNFCKEDITVSKYYIPQIQLYWELIPVMLLTFLSGYSVGSLLVLLFFLVTSITNLALSYKCFVLLMGSLLINLPIYKRYFLSLPKTILTNIAMIIFFGPGWNMLLRVLQGQEIVAKFELFHLFTATPFCTFICTFCYCYHKFLPQKYQNWFFATAVASDYAAEFRKKLRKQRHPKISTKIIIMLAGVVTLLLIASYGISISLFSMAHYDIQGFNLQEVQWDTIVFATRMVVLMTIVAVPAILISIGSINSMLTNPLILMTMALDDSSESNFEDQKIDIRNLNIKSKDEIGILYGALVHAFDVLDEYLKNLEREKQLSNDLEIAKEANKAKDTFLSSMSHEIRTPINAVLGLDEMIIRESKDQEITNYAIDIQNAGKSLLSIVNEILDFSKIEAGRMEIIPVEYDISSSINDLLNMISKRAEDKGLDLILKVDESLPQMLEGDEIRIKQCVINILTNAVKYTEKGSVTMDISWKKLNDEKIALTFHIIDTGIGIKEEDLPKLFSAFQRIEEKRNRTIEGTGLGMNIVQQLLSLMGSKLEVKSIYGQGSDFYFTIEQKVVSWDALGNIQERFAQSRKLVATHKEYLHAPEAKILVVDDTRLNLTVARGLLKQTQIQVDTAESGAETLELIKETKYDLIFLDHRMPIMDGIETLQAMKIQKENLCQETPCIALTANAIAGARESYIAAGFSDYLTKPIDSEKLEKMLIKYLPEDKVILTSQNTNPTEDVQTNQASSQTSENDLPSLTDIDLESGLKNCGNKEILLSAMQEFHSTISDKSKKIEDYAANHDWKNYTILVHALKSSARLIGANKLSSDAAYLEQCGDKTKAGSGVVKKAEAELEILEKTAPLLELYRSYEEKLKPILISKDDDALQKKNPISEAEYLEAMASLKECIQAFDFSTADQIIQMMEGYQIPENQRDEYKKIKEKLSAVDQAELLKLLE